MKTYQENSRISQHVILGGSDLHNTHTVNINLSEIRDAFESFGYMPTHSNIIDAIIWTMYVTHPTFKYVILKLNNRYFVFEKETKDYLFNMTLKNNIFDDDFFYFSAFQYYSYESVNQIKSQSITIENF